MRSIDNLRKSVRDSNSAKEVEISDWKVSFLDKIQAFSLRERKLGNYPFRTHADWEKAFVSFLDELSSSTEDIF